MLPGAFHGGFGLLNVYGCPKPAYRAFQLLHQAGDQRLAVAGSKRDSNMTCTDGGLLATLANGTLNLFLYNHLVTGPTGNNCTLKVVLKGVTSILPSSMATRIDEANANPKATFVSMGSPDSPSGEQLQAMEEASKLVWTPLSHTAGVTTHSCTPQCSISVEVPPHGLCVLRIPV